MMKNKYIQVLLICGFTVTFCKSAAVCEEQNELDARHPITAVTKCTVTTPDDLNSLPADITALWLVFPKHHNVTLAPGNFPAMPIVKYLRLDITFFDDFPPNLFQNVFMPEIRTFMLERDLNQVEAKQIAIEIVNNTFNGLSTVKNLYLDNLGIQNLQMGAFHGLDAVEIIDLTLNYLNEIPGYAFSTCKGLTSLKLSDNFISKLEDNAFAGLTKLASLDLSLNKLKRLNTGTLQDLAQLELLVLTSNSIQVIENGAFSAQSKMHYLSLARNNLNQLKPMALLGLGSLETLILDHNKLKLRMGQFAQTSNLLHLYLAHNDMTDANPDYFEGLLSLTELILSSNSINRLQTQTFYAMPTLMTLDISNNKIETVEENAFQGLGSLQTLNIQDNLISYLPPHSFDDLTQIKTLYMDQNPWVCDCDVKWLVSWLRQRINIIEPNVQFYYIICKETDPIPMETFFALIMNEHFFDDLNCDNKETIPSATTSKTTIQNNNPSKVTKKNRITTEKSVTKVYKEGLTKSQKVGISFSVILALIIAAVVVVFIFYRRKKKQRSWDPKQKAKINGNDMTGHKKVSNSSSANPEVLYWAKIWDIENDYHKDSTDLLKPAYLPGNKKPGKISNKLLHTYHNNGFTDSLNYIHQLTDINHQKRGDLSDNEETTKPNNVSIANIDSQRVVKVDIEPWQYKKKKQINVNKNYSNRKPHNKYTQDLVKQNAKCNNSLENPRNNVKPKNDFQSSQLNSQDKNSTLPVITSNIEVNPKLKEPIGRKQTTNNSHDNNDLSTKSPNKNTKHLNIPIRDARIRTEKAVYSSEVNSPEDDSGYLSQLDTTLDMSDMPV